MCQPEDDPIPAGSRWRDRDNGRVVVILGPGPNSPWMRYEGDPPASAFHCCIEDFWVWRRFERIL
jgi:hypothetical protein